MTHPAQKWLDLFDEAGVDYLAPQHCRNNLFAADAIIAPCRSMNLNFAEFPLLGEPVFDMTWSVEAASFSNSDHPLEGLAAAQITAGKLQQDKSAVLIEYDLSEQALGSPSCHFSGWLEGHRHCIGEILRDAGREGEVHHVLVTAAKLTRLGYETNMCGIMGSRLNSPVRFILKPKGKFPPQRLFEDLVRLGFAPLPQEAQQQIKTLLSFKDHLLSAPLLHVDLNPDGSLGTTLGLEFSGIRSHNAESYHQLALAQQWGLADDRWKDLAKAVAREAAQIDWDNQKARAGQAVKNFSVYSEFNTLKFRWRDGQALPVKLYLKVCW